MELQFKDLVNDYDAVQEFHELCLKNGWTTEESFSDFDPLTQFEGDPDYIKLGQSVCYFVKIGNVVWYYPSCDEEVALDTLTKFYEGKLELIEEQNWDAFNKLTDALAYRGGSGYVYTLYKV